MKREVAALSERAEAGVSVEYVRFQTGRPILNRQQPGQQYPCHADPNRQGADVIAITLRGVPIWRTEKTCVFGIFFRVWQETPGGVFKIYGSPKILF